MTTRYLDLKPLSVMTDTVLCDAPNLRTRHEVTIWTDGITAYAVSVDENYEQTGFSRDGVTITAECPCEYGEAPCDGTLTWRLDTPSAWTTDELAISMLGYGEKIDR